MRNSIIFWTSRLDGLNRDRHGRALPSSPMSPIAFVNEARRLAEENPLDGLVMSCRARRGVSFGRYRAGKIFRRSSPECSIAHAPAITASSRRNPDACAFPHSRSNDLPFRRSLRSYEILFDLAGRRRTVHQQERAICASAGSSGIDPDSLLREYHRDSQIPAQGTRGYPQMPTAISMRRGRRTGRVRERALVERHIDLLAISLRRRASTVAHAWRPQALRIYANWLSSWQRADCRRTRAPMRDKSIVGGAFPDPRRARARDDFLTRELPRANARIAHGSVVPTFNLASFKKELAGLRFCSPRPLNELLSWSIAQLEHGIVQMTPRATSALQPAPTFPASARIDCRALNPQLATWTTPRAVEMRRMSSRRSRCGGVTSGCRGHCTAGGSEANCTASCAH